MIRRDLPALAFVIVLLLLLDACVALIVSSFLDVGTASFRASYAVGSCIVIVTCILVLMNRGPALPFAFVSVCLLTVDSFVEHVPAHFPSLSPQGIRAVLEAPFHAALCWAAFAWYVRWRRGSLAAGSG